MTLEEEIVRLLQQRIGFNPDSIGQDKVLAAVRGYLKGQTIPDPAKYLAGLRAGGPAFQEIIDSVVVPETWFFRDGEPFELLKRFVTDWWPRSQGQTLRCLSLPCATGEEPYSIAMTLLDFGLAPERFSIDAVDICPKLLQRAKQGVFGPYSFRSADLSFRERHFEPREGLYHLRKHVRERVCFEHGNLLEALFMNDGRQYDIVFCRNLLIYFDPPSWKIALKTLNRLLRDSGLLFMGHAEMLDLASPDFEPVRFPSAFAYRKRLSGKEPPHPRSLGPRRGTARPKQAGSVRKHSAGPARTQARSFSRRNEAAAGAPSAKDGQGIEIARELADDGRLAEAEAACIEHLVDHPSSAAAYFLLGLIKEASSQTSEAEAYYQRALYLDSRHHEAMIHLALMLEGRGDMAGAETLRRRAARVRTSI